MSLNITNANLANTNDNKSSKDAPIINITIFGVGNCGGNTVTSMVGTDMDCVKFITCDTDIQKLNKTNADEKIQLGIKSAQGLGAGASPIKGKEAAIEAIDEIKKHLTDTRMLFIAAGMGGGTGTGAAPVIAEVAKELGILTIGVVTKPFDFERKRRGIIAQGGIDEMEKFVDSIIVVNNQKLFLKCDANSSLTEAFAQADKVLHAGVRGIVDLIINPGIINCDFEDVVSVVKGQGKAVMGTGESSGEGRATQAAEDALSNSLLEDNSIKGAKNLLINITTNGDLTLMEVGEIVDRIADEASEDVNIIQGAAINDNLDGVVRVSIIATGISQLDNTDSNNTGDDDKKNPLINNNFDMDDIITITDDIDELAKKNSNTEFSKIESINEVLTDGISAVETVIAGQPEKEISKEIIDEVSQAVSYSPENKDNSPLSFSSEFIDNDNDTIDSVEEEINLENAPLLDHIANKTNTKTNAKVNEKTEKKTGFFEGFFGKNKSKSDSPGSIESKEQDNLNRDTTNFISNEKKIVKTNKIKISHETARNLTEAEKDYNNLPLFLKRQAN